MPRGGERDACSGVLAGFASPHVARCDMIETNRGFFQEMVFSREKWAFIFSSVPDLARLMNTCDLRPFSLVFVTSF